MPLMTSCTHCSTTGVSSAMRYCSTLIWMKGASCAATKIVNASRQATPKLRIVALATPSMVRKASFVHCTPIARAKLPPKLPTA